MQDRSDGGIVPSFTLAVPDAMIVRLRWGRWLKKDASGAERLPTATAWKRAASRQLKQFRLNNLQLLKRFRVGFAAAKDTHVEWVMQGACQKQMALLRGDLQRVKTENTKANKEYESLKAEVLKAVQGQSALPMDVLNEGIAPR